MQASGGEDTLTLRSGRAVRGTSSQSKMDSEDIETYSPCRETIHGSTDGSTRPKNRLQLRNLHDQEEDITEEEAQDASGDARQDQLQDHRPSHQEEPSHQNILLERMARLLMPQNEDHQDGTNINNHERPLHGSSLPSASRSHNADMGKAHVKPPVFDGTTPWTDYLVQFEMVAEMNQWNDKQMAMYLATSLRGVAQSVLGDLDNIGRYHYPSLLDKMNQRFGPQNQTEMFRALLRNRQRKPQESLPDLAHEIRKLVKLAYPTGDHGLREELAKDYFIDAIPESEYRWQIQQTRPTTLDDVVRTAVELEAFHTAERHRAQNKKNIRVVQTEKTTKNDSTTAKSIEQLQELVEALTKKMEETSRPSHIRCYNCGRMGHKQQYCTEKSNGQSRQQYQRYGKPSNNNSRTSGN